jgi:hypothetical protein
VKVAIVAVLALAACADDIDPPWQLDHDRIIAVRATPPHIPAGASTTIDLLVGHKGAPTTEQPPDLVRVVSPMSLAGAAGGGATITAPDEQALAVARTELGLPPGAPVPLQIGVSSGGLLATKIVWLGDSADNPVLSGLLINGAPPPAADISVGVKVDVPLFVEADDAKDIVTWLTSCGTMHDFDLHSAYLRVEPDDPQTGELAVVLRDDKGGVVWQRWQIAAH